MRPVKEEWSSKKRGGGEEEGKDKEEEEEGREETRFLRVQTKVSLQVAPQLQVLCTPYSACISLPFSSFSRSFARPLYDFIFLLPMLHPAECLVARCIKRTFYRFFSLSLSLSSFSCAPLLFLFFRFLRLFYVYLLPALRNRPTVASETESKVKGVCLLQI